MKLTFLLTIVVLFCSCSTTQLEDSWKNPDIISFIAKKVLIIGMTSNKKARIKFEEELKNEFELREIIAIKSIDFFEPSFNTEKMSKEAINQLENKLINEGFDTVLFTIIKGVEDKIAYKKSYYNYNKTTRRFRDDYFKYQDIYYNPEYYDEYKVYHAETSLYSIYPIKNRALIWKGYIDIVNPKNIETTVKEYVQLVLFTLEEQKLIHKKNTIQEPSKVEIVL